MMPDFIDDKSEHCIPFLLERLRIHRERHAGHADPPPFFLGLNGVQGAGKTTLVRALCRTLRSAPYNLPTAIISIDDLYLPHAQLLALASQNPQNPLVQHRGQPSTHDLPLAVHTFSSLRQGLPTKIPAFDKSGFHGQGERVPETEWEEVNKAEDGEEDKIKVVIYEGWCVGFRALDEKTLRQKWEDAVRRKEKGGYSGRLGHSRFEDVRFVNEALRGYDALTDQLDALIHIDAVHMTDVYAWRQEQETALRASKGTGMTDEQVIKFVDGYYPSYELFTDSLREGVFRGENARGRQLRLVVGTDRRVQEVFRT